MCTPTQLDHDLFRILLYRNDSAELLVEAKPDRLRLPLLSAPAHTRIAEEITTAIKSMWNLETYCLFPLVIGGSCEAQVRYHVVEVCQADTDAPTGMQWLPRISLAGEMFEDSNEYVAIERSLATFDQYRHGQLSGTFGKPGWLRVVTEWVESQATAAGLCLTGRFHQLNASPTFSLIRFETDGPALWFKAVGEPNLQEYSITLKLASSFPGFVPHIVASRPDWNGWLALEAEGGTLDATSPEGSWEAAAETLALLQVSSIGRRFELIQAGCKDLRTHCLMDLVDPFIEAATKLMARQSKLSPAPLGRHELLALGRSIVAALRELEDAGVPNALGHLDLSPGNALVGKQHCVFIDWAEAYVGSPFFSFQYLLQHWRRLHQEDPHKEVSLVSCYAKIWARFASPEQIATTFKLAPLLAAFVYAAGGSAWHDPENLPSETAAYLRSLVRRMKLEADALWEGRHVCLL
jgi:hypothetical protein